MRQTKVKSLQDQSQKPQRDHHEETESINQYIQSKNLNDIFKAMQKNFDQNFNDQIPKEIPKIQTENIQTESSKEVILSSRPSRKVKPIYSTVVKKQYSSNQQTQNFDPHDELISEPQNFSSPSVEKQNRKIDNQENLSPQKSSKTSPYTRIRDCLHQSVTNEFKISQENPTLIQNIQNQRHFHKESNFPSYASKSPRVLNYKDLQQKIESALKKNTNYKPLGTLSTLKKSNSTSRTFNEFNSLLLSRFEEYEKNRSRQIQQKKAELEQRKLKQLKFHPKINKKSLQFIEEMGGHEPLEHRYQKILQLKNKRIKQYEEQRKQKEKEEYDQFIEEFLKHQKSPEQKTRSYDQFYEQMFKWKQRNMKKAEEKRKMFEQKQFQDTNIFQPKINKKSEKIVMNSTKSEKHLPIYEREIPSSKKFKSKIDEQCTFKPKINKRKAK